MRKNILIIASSFLILVSINVLFFRSFYRLQISQQKNLLFKQTHVCSEEIEQTIQKFESDLNYILYSEQIPGIFMDGEKSEGLRQLELFYSSYHTLIKNIDIYDRNKNVLNIFRDRKKNFITDNYIAQRQKDLAKKEEVIVNNSDYQYVLPVFSGDSIYANVLVTVNLNNYILSVLDKFHLEDITWQWVVDPELNEISNSEGIKIPTTGELEKVDQNLEKGLSDMLIHTIKNDSVSIKVLTVYAPVNVLKKNFGIAMSADYNIFLKQIFSELALIASLSLCIFLLVSWYLLRQILSLKKKIQY